MINSSLAGNNRWSLVTIRVRALLLRHPQWRTWLLALFAWALLVIGLSANSPQINHIGNIIYCTPTGTSEVPGGYTASTVLSLIVSTMRNGLLPCIIMIMAMMFPLLNEPVKHVAFSTRRKDRDIAIFCFLMGYLITWIVTGMLFLLLPVFLNIAAGKPAPFVQGLISAAVFLLAALISWLPYRPIQMMKCRQTMPISIRGWQLPVDSFLFGLKTGATCICICWIPMAALMLAPHNMLLMYIATVVLILERYLLPHSSKFPGYAWTVIGLAICGIEVWG